MAPIERASTRVPITIVNGTWVGDKVIHMAPFAGGIVHIPAAMTGTTIMFLVSPYENTGFGPLKDDANALITVTISGDTIQANSIPEKIFGAHFVKVVTMSTDGTPTDQAADRPLWIMLKG